MIQNIISTFLLYIWIIFILVWLYSFNFIVLGILFVSISPKIQDKEYEYKKWEKEYLSN